MKIRLPLFIQGSYILATLLLLLVALFSYRNFQSLLHREAWVSHTYEVIYNANQLLSFVKDAETGQRGYLLSKDSSYLKPYFTGLDSVPVYLRRLKRLTSDNPRQQQALGELTQHITDRFEYLRMGLSLRDQQKEEEFQRLIDSGAGMQKMEAVRTGIARFIQTEEHLLQQRSLSYRKTLTRTEYIILAVIALSITAKVISLLYTTYQLKIKERYEKELQQLNEQLATTNEELQASNEELATSTEELLTTNEQLEAIKQDLEITVQQRTLTLQEALENLQREATQHKQTADALRKSEERFRIALQNAPVAVFNQDRDLRYTWVYNPNVGPESSTMLGKTDNEILSTADSYSLMSLKKRVIDTGEGITREVQITGRETKVVYIITLEPIVGPTGEITGIAGAAYDISQLKQTEENLRHTLAELKNRNLELDNYVYKVSHDLRAPLTSILGLINLIEMEENPARVREYIGLIKNRINKSDEFIRSILNHSKIINSKVTYTVIDFQKMIQDCVEELKYHPNAEKLTLVIHESSNIPFYGDEVRLNIVLRNFVSNAVKYLNPSAPTPFLRFDIQVTVAQAVIVVEDNGIGIEQQYLNNIFDMFFRGTEKSEGSGLGLYIVQQTVQRLNGSITVESTVGRGTTFTLTLPNHPAPSANRTGSPFHNS